MQTIPDRFSGLAALPPDRRFVAFDYPGLKISIAEYDEGPTGCTVLSFDAPATCVSDIRGGAPGFLGGYGVADAICFAGGSLYGLEAATRVSAEILKERGNARGGKLPACNLPLSTILAPGRPRCTQTRHLARSPGPTRRAEVARSVR